MSKLKEGEISKFKYECKYCYKTGLAWKMLKKYTLMDTIETPHVCEKNKSKHKKTVIEGEVNQYGKTLLIKSSKLIGGVGYAEQEEKVTHVLKMKKVKLKDAKKMYQPVYGTSKSSTYYVIAMFEGLNFACRIREHSGYTVSVRAEGPMAMGDKLGVINKFSKGEDYYSCHWEMDSIADAKACVLGCISQYGGSEPLSIFPDMNKIPVT